MNINSFKIAKPNKINIMLWLAADSFLGITYPLSAFLALGFSALLVFNYTTTYNGFSDTFPNLGWLVVLGFVAVVQGVQLIIPILEAAEIHKDLPFAWIALMWVGWGLSVVADFYTAVVSLAIGASLGLTGIVLFDPKLWTTSAGLIVLIFSGILVTSEIWVALSWRAVIHLHKRFWPMVNKRAPAPAKPVEQTQPSVHVAPTLRVPSASTLPRSLSPTYHPSPRPMMPPSGYHLENGHLVKDSDKHN